MKKIIAVVVVVAMFALTSTTLMAAPTRGATQAADQAGLFAKVLSFFAVIGSDTTPARGKGKGSDKSIQDPGRSTNDGAIWRWCRTYGC